MIASMIFYENHIFFLFNFQALTPIKTISPNKVDPMPKPDGPTTKELFCNICQIEFGKKFGFQRHMKTQHPGKENISNNVEATSSPIMKNKPQKFYQKSEANMKQPTTPSSWESRWIPNSIGRNILIPN